MQKKPCPFCQNLNAPENDTGGACCFCDYEGFVIIGDGGTFSNLQQYNKVYFAANHQDRLDEIHGRNDIIKQNTFFL